MIAIGIAGALRAGKDTVAHHLIEHYGFQRIGFADALKAEVRERLAGTLEEIATLWWYADIRVNESIDGPAKPTIDTLFETKPAVMRRLLQEYGTEIRRNDDPEYWVMQWIARVKALPSGSRVVVPDTRFRNEAEMIATLCTRSDRPWQSWLVRVTRPGYHGDGHASERDLDDWPLWDATIDNRAGLAELQAQVDGWAASVGLTRAPRVR